MALVEQFLLNGWDGCREEYDVGFSKIRRDAWFIPVKSVHFYLQGVSVLVVRMVATVPKIGFGLGIMLYTAPIDSVFGEDSSILCRPVRPDSANESDGSEQTGSIRKVTCAATEDSLPFAYRRFDRIDGQSTNAENIH
jgi:hypothetical protein